MVEPNPNPRGLYLDMAGSADEARVRVYSAAMTCVALFDLPGDLPAGWDELRLPQGWSQGLANGPYFVVVESARQGQWRQAPSPLTLYLLR